MDILALIAAFGGGIIGAYMGALPAFIMTGIYALVGGVLTAAGVGGDVAVNYLAFGSFVGPHIAFAGGVAAAGYAGRKGKLASGTDILSSLNGLGEPDVLLVGGIFGVLGFLIHYCIGLLPVIGSAGPATTDLPGITVFIQAGVPRLAFGTTGLTGKYTGSGKREWFATGKGFVYNVVLGGGIGIVVSFIAAFLYENEFTAAFSIFPIVCFGFAAITLIFTQTGFATPATHHIFLPSGLAAVHHRLGPCGRSAGRALRHPGLPAGRLGGQELEQPLRHPHRPPCYHDLYPDDCDQRCQQRDQCLSQQRNP